VAAGFGSQIQGSIRTARRTRAHSDEVRQIAGVVSRALSSITAITRDAGSSELYGLWQEAGSEKEWLAAVTDLRTRLEAIEQ
jgi:hypothetical protein